MPIRMPKQAGQGGREWVEGAAVFLWCFSLSLPLSPSSLSIFCQLLRQSEVKVVSISNRNALDFQKKKQKNGMERKKLSNLRLKTKS